jgi:hypothetical protein
MRFLEIVQKWSMFLGGGNVMCLIFYRGPYMLIGYTSYILSPVIWYFLCICDYFYIAIVWYKLIPAAVRSKAKVCGRSIPGITGSDTADGTDVFSCVSSVDSVLCDVLITRAEKSYCVCV